MSGCFFFTQRWQRVALAVLVMGVAGVMGCSPKAEPPPESAWTAVSASGPPPPPGGAVPAPPQIQPAFPTSVAGFRFGSDLARAQKTCGRRLLGTPQKARCDNLPVRLGFAQPIVELDFTEDELVGVFIRATSWNAAWRALASQYAAPDVLVEQVKTRWVRLVRHGAQWTEGPVGAAKARHLSAMWALMGGGIYLLQTNQGAFVWYRSARTEQPQPFRLLY